jgi:hypothetical protein
VRSRRIRYWPAKIESRVREGCVPEYSEHHREPAGCVQPVDSPDGTELFRL